MEEKVQFWQKKTETQFLNRAAKKQRNSVHIYVDQLEQHAGEHALMGLGGYEHCLLFGIEGCP